MSNKKRVEKKNCWLIVDNCCPIKAPRPHTGILVGLCFSLSRAPRVSAPFVVSLCGICFYIVCTAKQIVRMSFRHLFASSVLPNTIRRLSVSSVSRDTIRRLSVSSVSWDTIRRTNSPPFACYCFSDCNKLRNSFSDTKKHPPACIYPFCSVLLPLFYHTFPFPTLTGSTATASVKKQYVVCRHSTART